MACGWTPQVRIGKARRRNPMMDKPEKSDSVVVAMKSTNKAERSAAEPVEPRTGTKGNADQQRTRRAQDRESVSQALERVRLAARRWKQARFTALLHHINFAYHAVPTNSPGVIRAPIPCRGTLAPATLPAQPEGLRGLDADGGAG